MKRRFINTRGLILTSIAVVAVLVFFTTVLMPLERVLVSISRGALLGAADITAVFRAHTFDENRLRIVARQIDEFQETFLLNKNLSPGTRIVAQNVLIGVIDDAGRMRAITAPLFRVDGVFTRSGIQAVFVGRGAGILAVELPRGSDVSIGDDIYSNTSHALLLGQVARIIETPADPFQTVLVLSPVDLSTIFYVDAL